MDEPAMAPYRPQDRRDVAEMLSGLERSRGKSKGRDGFSCKKATFAVDGSDIRVDSWRMQDWDYKKANLPTYARGLFTTVNGKGHPEIAVRGYDKFFNHGEVRETEWRNVETDTRGPYELSVKENGCIIFLSGLEDGTLLVCSKHSTGGRPDLDVSHAKVGERWVEKHLSTIGKTKQDLAVRLREMNATAVAELCDDEFEEHVLEYTPDMAGLYLHGINLNLPEFVTYPHSLVDRFAEEWGMKKTMYIVKDDIKEVKAFLDNVAETGNYAGRDTEGFVIRCQSKANTREWHDWFFKYKFEEPYLMYRQWRECTKAVIAGRAPKYRHHKTITEEYLLFARKQLHANPKLGKEYQNNHGIIKMRDDFLAYRGLKGSEIIRLEREAGEIADDAVKRDIVIMPAATIGCGKTTVALSLCRLFKWGHIQNDNITAKRGKPQLFATACTNALVDAPVVVADRNNHQKRERSTLLGDISKVLPNARFVCLHYVHDRRDYDRIRQATRERVLSRGDNHQTIHTSKGTEEIIGIMEGFMHRFEPVNPDNAPDDGFDTIIDLDPCASSRENLETVITRLYNEYPKLFEGQEMPTSEAMDAAIDTAMNEYSVDIKHDIKGQDTRHSKRDDKLKQKWHREQENDGAKKKTKYLEYFAVQLDPTRIKNILQAVFRDAPGDSAKMYNILKQLRRIQSDFHVTLMHRADENGSHAEYWKELVERYESACARTGDEPYITPQVTLGGCRVRLERIVWDERVMAIVVQLVAEGSQGGSWKSANEAAHITVGTASPSVKPKEANDMLKKWLREGTKGSGVLELEVPGTVELDGEVRAILQR